MREFKTPQGVVRNVAIDKLFIDRAYQREESSAQYKRIGDNFEWDFFGMPVVSHRGGGKYAILEGQHRYLGLKRRYPEGVYPNGQVVTMGVLVSTRKNEHEVFVAMNKSGTRRAITPNELFKANLGGGEKVEVAIRRVLLDNGIEIKFGKGAAEIGMTKAPAAFKEVYEAVGTASNFRQVVEMLVDNFSRPDGVAVEASTLASDFLKGLAKFLKSTGYTLPRISTALKAADVQAANIVQRARLAHLNSRYSMIDGIRNELEKLVEDNISRSRRRAA